MGCYLVRARNGAALLALVGALTFGSFASAAAPVDPTGGLAVQAGPPAQGRDGEVLRATLANGLRVVIVRNALAPVVTTQVTYLVGGYDTPAGFPGTAHALEHMMFRGSKGLSEPQLDAMVGKMGAEENAWTTSDATRYFFSAPARYLGLLLKIESIRMREATLTPEHWELERGAIEQEISRNVSNPGRLARDEAQRTLYRGTGYAEAPSGTRPSFDATTAADLRRFYDRWYTPNNAVLVIVGDVVPATVLGEVEKLFGAISRGPSADHAPLTLQPLRARTITRSTPDAAGSVEFMYRMPGMRSPDHWPMQVLLDILNNPRSRLSQLATEGKVLSTRFEIKPFAHGGIGTIAANFAHAGDPDTARRHLQSAVNALLAEGVSADLVNAAKREEHAKSEFAKGGSYDEASAWSWAVAWQGLAGPQAALGRIDAVTAADVDRVARTYLGADQQVTVVLTPGGAGKPAPRYTDQDASRRVPGEQTLVATLPPWAARELGTVAMPRWTLAPVRTRLANGLTLIVQPETASKSVTLVGHVDHDDGLQEPPGKEGVARLLERLFPFGTVAMDRTGVLAALDDIGASLSSGTDFSLAVPSKHFERGVARLADSELHPRLPVSDFKTQQEALAQILAGQRQSPHYRMTRALETSLLPAGDPGLRQATPQTVLALGLDDVKAYYGRVFRPDLTTIVVVGDITPERARSVIEHHFSGWKALGPKPDVVPAPVPVNAAASVRIPNAYASQEQVIMGLMMEATLGNPDRYALLLGNSVLGSNGGVGASRLMIDIRINHGYAYSVYSDMQFDRSRSQFLVGFGCDPDKLAAVDRMARQDIETMRTTPVTSEELMNARQALVHSVPLQVSSIERIAHGLLEWSRQGQPLDEPMVAARHYLDLDAEQVRDAFRKYVDPSNLVQVVQGPPERAE